MEALQDFLIFIAVGAALFAASCYKRCPSNKVIVVYSNMTGSTNLKCIHGGGVYIWPVFQDYGVLSLDTMVTDINLKRAFSKDNDNRVTMSARFAFGISPHPKLLQNAAEKLLFSDKERIIAMASDVILSQLRFVIATLSFEEINRDMEKFLELININVDSELNKLGLEVINVNIRDITNEKL